MTRWITSCSFAIGLAIVALASAGCGGSAPVHANRAEALAIRQRLEKTSKGAGASEKEQLAEPQGWATLRGRFVVEGSVAKFPPLALSGGDAAYCSQNGTPPDERVIVGEGGGLRDVVVFLTTETPSDDPKWEHPDYAELKSASLAGPIGFDQKGCRFLSHVFAMRSSQKVMVINSDTVGHNTNISGSPPKVQSINPNLPAGASVEYAPGGQSNQPFSVSCSIHPWMKAWMITRNNPYFAVSDADGNFEIKNVPAGVDLEFRAWQEKVTFLGAVNVNRGDGAKKEAWKKGRFPVKLDPGATLDMHVAIDGSVFK